MLLESFRSILDKEISRMDILSLLYHLVIETVLFIWTNLPMTHLKDMTLNYLSSIKYNKMSLVVSH